jgi:hypothetical protein
MLVYLILWCGRFTYSGRVYQYNYVPSACAILSSVASPAVLRISTLSHKWLDFRRGVEHILYIKIKWFFVPFCLFVPYTNPHF